MGSGKDHEPRLGSAESLSPYCMAEVYATLSMAKTATFIFLLESISYYEIFLLSVTSIPSDYKPPVKSSLN